MNNKIIKLIAFCMAVTLMIFSPAICSLGFDLYLNISMKSTGKLPTVNTQEKLEKLLEYDYRDHRIYISVGTPVKSTGRNPFENVVDTSVRTSNDSFNSTFGGSLSFDVSVSESASDYSSTNVQVEGIDEADILKIDGKYIYMIVNDKLVIVEAFPYFHHY